MTKRKREASDQFCAVLFVITNLETHLMTEVLDEDMTVLDLKRKLILEHQECFPKFGEVKVDSLKVEHWGYKLQPTNSMLLKRVLEIIDRYLFIAELSCQVLDFDTLDLRNDSVTAGPSKVMLAPVVPSSPKNVIRKSAAKRGHDDNLHSPRIEPIKKRKKTKKSVSMHEQEAVVQNYDLVENDVSKAGVNIKVVDSKNDGNEMDVGTVASPSKIKSTGRLEDKSTFASSFLHLMEESGNVENHVEAWSNSNILEDIHQQSSLDKADSNATNSKAKAVAAMLETERKSYSALEINDLTRIAGVPDTGEEASGLSNGVVESRMEENPSQSKKPTKKTKTKTKHNALKIILSSDPMAEHDGGARDPSADENNEVAGDSILTSRAKSVAATLEAEQKSFAAGEMNNIAACEMNDVTRITKVLDTGEEAPGLSRNDVRVAKSGTEENPSESKKQKKKTKTKTKHTILKNKPSGDPMAEHVSGVRDPYADENIEVGGDNVLTSRAKSVAATLEAEQKSEMPRKKSKSKQDVVDNTISGSHVNEKDLGVRDRITDDMIKTVGAHEPAGKVTTAVKEVRNCKGGDDRNDNHVQSQEITAVEDLTNSAMLKNSDKQHEGLEKPKHIDLPSSLSNGYTVQKMMSSNDQPSSIDASIMQDLANMGTSSGGERKAEDGRETQLDSVTEIKEHKCQSKPMGLICADGEAGKQHGRLNGSMTKSTVLSLKGDAASVPSNDTSDTKARRKQVQETRLEQHQLPPPKLPKLVQDSVKKNGIAIVNTPVGTDGQAASRFQVNKQKPGSKQGDIRNSSSKLKKDVGGCLQRKKSMLVTADTIFGDDGGTSDDESQYRSPLGSRSRTTSDISSSDSGESLNKWRTPGTGFQEGGISSFYSTPWAKKAVEPLEKALKRSKRYKNAFLAASQSQPDVFELDSQSDVVPDSQTLFQNSQSLF